MSGLTVVDTNILDCLLHAMERGELPPMNDPALADQQVATLRLLLWRGLSVGRVAADEIRRVPDAAKRRALDSIIQVLLPEVWIQSEDVPVWNARVNELRKRHRGEMDCRLVAEGEMVGASVLLSFDKAMVRRLGSHAKIRVLFPTVYWNELAIPRGTPPKWTPAPSNPFAHATFWRWDAR